MRLHELKCWPAPFDEVWRGTKRHEIRRDDDRGFDVGDHLRLREWDPSSYPGSITRTPRGFTGRIANAVITYKSEGGTWGLLHGLCVLSILVTETIGGPS